MVPSARNSVLNRAQSCGLAEKGPLTAIRAGNSMRQALASARATSSTAVHVEAEISRIAIGALPDKNYAGDPGIHGPDGTDWHLMIGSLRYEWNMLLGRIYGTDRTR